MFIALLFSETWTFRMYWFYFQNNEWVRFSETPEGECLVLRWRCLTGRVWKVICRDVLQSFIFRGVMLTVSFSTRLCKNTAEQLQNSRQQTVSLIHFCSTDESKTQHKQCWGSYFKNCSQATLKVVKGIVYWNYWNYILTISSAVLNNTSWYFMFVFNFI